MPSDPDLVLATIPDQAKARAPVTAEQRAVYLEVLAKTGSQVQAATAAHPAVSPESATHYFRALARRDTAFAEAVRQALVRVQAALETMIVDHAVNGWEEPVVFMGKVIEGQKVRKFDHKLSLAVAKRNARLLGDDSWEDKKTVTHEGQAEVKHTINFRDLPAEERARILADARAVRHLASSTIDTTATEKKP